MTLDALESAARQRHLTILGGFHPEAADDVPADCATLLLLGPHEPHFWPRVTTSAEWHDGAPDPLDRWSRRVIGELAAELGAVPLFPFGGPPYLPFFRWALRTGRVHASPIRLLVHDHAGLFVSFRGALALPRRVALPPAPPSPCLACTAQPCRSACPVGALDGTTYDVSACKEFLDAPDGRDCMERGCKARRICPVSQGFARLPAQSAYHMTAFKG